MLADNISNPLFFTQGPRLYSTVNPETSHIDVKSVNLQFPLQASVGSMLTTFFTAATLLQSSIAKPLCLVTYKVVFNEAILRWTIEILFKP
jgi:hypothetical protein